MAAPKDATKAQQPLTPKKLYLILYNACSAIAWLTVLGRTVGTLTSRSYPLVYLVVGEWTKWTQTAAALEVLHSLLGIVRAPLLTTLMQVSSRFLLVWLIVNPFPHLAASPFYSSMLLAWSITEVIRYSFFALSLSGWTPRFLTWLRYNTFFVLYPLGITSECALVYLATEPAGEEADVYKLALYGVLATYVPGAYMLYTYMMQQRRKVMRSLKAQDPKASR